ncbi:alpha/beta fold hydrolase [Mangrovicoccus algicola]|uniref:Alpha/beta hydrolase n=1 Tax=Mangrovicoccus algicola TaxID=2771008 RepID=A0A8J6YVU0_9RHOB|nr:alpha/beta hydrolase [Mangrovicoccus algicola]MBE3638687.1 alpha/beta hydrolase [Mangrovicoccus algicola]
MESPSYLDTPQGRRLAYHRREGQGPGVVFLGGFMSDMAGTKATYLQAWAEARDRAFLRFDYSGHGRSEGAFTEGTIGRWAEDAAAVINAVTAGPQILVGSSMGGWIALLLLRRALVDCAGLVTIAAAPDFTEDGFWDGFSNAAREELMSHGVVHVPSDYGSPYPITRGLIEDGRRNMVLREPLALPVPVRFLQGTADRDVDPSRAMLLLNHAQGGDIRLTLVKGADHAFSSPDCLALIEQAIAEVLEAG